ncbi:hypothetical protein AC579_3198 [Pseudocercospora musae]|uniref:pectin lyase n=1 Tax=Pseudocercospora musae TaxID=113226 RepID=A0A139ISL9_9PEZI|nr:hypothetical protein AC579_3198 [Pseudocercospora musae]
MLSHSLIALALAAVPAFTQSVSGSPEGFASGTTGGAAGETVTPTSIDELTEYLTAEEPYTIVLTKTFDYTGSEGTTTETGCAPWGTAAGCQQAINANDWCADYQSGAGAIQVTYDVAGTSAIKVASDKTIIGSGSSGVIKGKGLSFQSGVSNIILQNIEITDLNPQFVWGGDAITLNGCSNVWIDHVKVSLVGRQMIVAGYETNTAITISNCEFDGQTSWSASCDGHHYWNLFFVGENDRITFKGNYIHHTSGRAPKLGGGTLFHAVNNYWSDNSGHAFEGEDAYLLLEGSTFDNVNAPDQDWSGSAYVPTTEDSACSSGLGRSCAATSFVDSGTFGGTDSSVLSQFSGLEEIAEAEADASGVPQSAGVGKLSGSSRKSNSTSTRSSVRRAGRIG